jgi:hypothetical protein
MSLPLRDRISVWILVTVFFVAAMLMVPRLISLSKMTLPKNDWTVAGASFPMWAIVEQHTAIIVVSAATLRGAATKYLLRLGFLSKKSTVELRSDENDLDTSGVRNGILAGDQIRNYDRSRRVTAGSATTNESQDSNDSHNSDFRDKRLSSIHNQMPVEDLELENIPTDLKLQQRTSSYLQRQEERLDISMNRWRHD